jgi:2-polyprenyl-3-methyl-5-hydroxy-6-metoxy-1,4-benzoquinol methylase
VSDAIRTIATPHCCLCGAEGRLLYSGLRDRLFSAPGEWSHRECKNQGCALVWLDPLPREEDIHKAYASYYTHVEAPERSGALARLFAAAKRGYLANRFGYLEDLPLPERALGILPLLYPGRAAELEFSVMWLEPRTRGRLLDVGAGSGWLVEHMTSLGWRAEGLDFDARAVERARSHGLVMHQGGLAEQRFAEASFDAVTMSHAIEHVHDPVGWLAETRRILKPGGRLSIATPNTKSLLHRRFGANWFALDPPRHLHLFNRAALATALRSAGFERFRIFTSVRDANGAWIGSRAIGRTGRHDMVAASPAATRVAGRAVQLAEAARKLVDRDAGEDLVAIAEK